MFVIFVALLSFQIAYCFKAPSPSLPRHHPTLLRQRCLNRPIATTAVSATTVEQQMNDDDEQQQQQQQQNKEEDGDEVLRRRLKTQLLNLAQLTERGFKASRSDRAKMNRLMEGLAKKNPTLEPASPYYYPDDNNDSSDFTYTPEQPTTTIVGKWTLVYTDAPDIISLANGPPTAQLGRIGQECSPPFIKNVIEWKRPSWAATLLPSWLLLSNDNKDNDDDEPQQCILQKVCTKATASPMDPMQLNLDLAGIELVVSPSLSSSTTETGSSSSSSSSRFRDDEEDNQTIKDKNSITSSSSSSFLSTMQRQGLPVALLQSSPVKLFLEAPFGKARILYLDSELRILRTSQNYVAVNIRSDPEWF